MVGGTHARSQGIASRNDVIASLARVITSSADGIASSADAIASRVDAIASGADAIASGADAIAALAADRDLSLEGIDRCAGCLVSETRDTIAGEEDFMSGRDGTIRAFDRTSGVLAHTAELFGGIIADVRRISSDFEGMSSALGGTSTTICVIAPAPEGTAERARGSATRQCDPSSESSHTIPSLGGTAACPEHCAASNEYAATLFEDSSTVAAWSAIYSTRLAATKYATNQSPPVLRSV
jgi:hypothetical protein